MTFIDFKPGERVKPNVSFIPHVDKEKVYIIQSVQLNENLIYLVNDEGEKKGYHPDSFDWTLDYYKPDYYEGEFYIVKDYKYLDSYHWHGSQSESTFKLTLQGMDRKIHTANYTIGSTGHIDFVGKIVVAQNGHFEFLPDSLSLGHPIKRTIETNPIEDPYDGWIY